MSFTTGHAVNFGTGGTSVALATLRTTDTTTNLNVAVPGIAVPDWDVQDMLDAPFTWAAPNPSRLTLSADLRAVSFDGVVQFGAAGQRVTLKARVRKNGAVDLAGRGIGYARGSNTIDEADSDIQGFDPNPTAGDFYEVFMEREGNIISAAVPVPVGCLWKVEGYS